LGGCPRVTVCENPFARNELPDEIFTGEFDERNRYDVDSQRIERVYAGKGLEEIERGQDDELDVPRELDRFTKEIIEKFGPERIVLFGSYAHDAAGPDSDVDLLVILPGDGDADRLSLEIRKRLPCRFPLDLLTRSAGEIDRRLKLKDPFIREILENGKTLYRREKRGGKKVV